MYVPICIGAREAVLKGFVDCLSVVLFMFDRGECRPFSFGWRAESQLLETVYNLYLLWNWLLSHGPPLNLPFRFCGQGFSRDVWRAFAICVLLLMSYTD
jgi:hypothetical protein